MNTAEEAFIRSFVSAAKRERYLGFLSSEKNRVRFLRELPHFSDFDDRYATRVSDGEQTDVAIGQLLRDAGAGDKCHAISEDPSIDGQELYLDEALGTVVGSGHGTVLSCVPGEVAYFEGEDPGERYLLKRRN